MSRVIFPGKLLSETENCVFDFTSRLASGETISSAVVTASVYSGTDASPSSILSGGETISGAKVTQRVTAGVLGVTYELLCSADTTAAQVLSLSGYLTIIPDLM